MTFYSKLMVYSSSKMFKKGCLIHLMLLFIRTSRLNPKSLTCELRHEDNSDMLGGFLLIKESNFRVFPQSDSTNLSAEPRGEVMLTHSSLIKTTKMQNGLQAPPPMH